ncbi:MAG TPA: hypothetical protein VIU37_01885, partial [Candidatus Limnocylindrales bacterium]
MGWLEDFGAVAGALGAKAASSAPSSYTSWNTRLRSSGYQTDYGQSSLVTWSDLGSGSLGSGITPPFSSIAPRTPKQPYVPAAPPERFDIKYPVRGFGGQGIAPPPKMSTQGDVFGSITGAIGDTLGHLNLSNAVPWFMERVNVLADEASRAGVPGAAMVKAPLDVFATGVKAASDVIAPVLDAFPGFVRDGQLQDRAKLYRAIVTGGQADFGPLGPISNPLGTLAQYGAQFLIPGGQIPYMAGDVTGGPVVQATTSLFGKPVSAQDWEYQRYRQMLLGTIDPNQRATIEQRMGILRESIDIPPSVKIAIERNPNMTDSQLEQALSTAPEGRQWSYQGGAPGAVQNFGTSLLFYLAEARAIGLAGRGVG